MNETDTTGTILSLPPSPCQIGLRPRPKSIRKPLQPKNDFSNNTTVPKFQLLTEKPKPDPRASIPDPSNKENFTSTMNSRPLPKGAKSDVKIINIEPFEVSLAEELSSIRKRKEMLKLEKDKTEKLLKERDLMLDMQMHQLQIRGEAQKHLENQVDRLFRLKERRLSSLKISPFRPLRDKEEGKKIKKEQGQERELSIDESNMGDQNSTMEGIDGADYK